MDGHQGDEATLQAILEHESSSISSFEVEGDRAQSAHVEEGLVLDLRDSLMVQVLAVHESSRLAKVVLGAAAAVASCTASNHRV